MRGAAWSDFLLLRYVAGDRAAALDDAVDGLKQSRAAAFSAPALFFQFEQMSSPERQALTVAPAHCATETLAPALIDSTIRRPLAVIAPSQVLAMDAAPVEE